MWDSKGKQVQMYVQWHDVVNGRDDTVSPNHAMENHIATLLQN